jgi:hypothetical protein
MGAYVISSRLSAPPQRGRIGARIVPTLNYSKGQSIMATYNGWTNYATWRVNLEIFDGQDPEGFDLTQDAYDLGRELKDYAEELIDATSNEGLARDYALAFLSDVNWREIASYLIEEYLLAQEDAEA